jgi:predicted Zn-ribbon and HTH transcriptional regulator
MPRTSPSSDAPGCPPRRETIRHALHAALRAADGPLTAHELSHALHVSEKDVFAHLEHLGRSLAREGASLVVVHPTCLACGFAFAKRDRLGRPGRCPVCKSTRIDPPRFSVRPRPR